MSDITRGTSAIYRMPTVFGPAVGPRQAPEGISFDQSKSPKKFCAYVSFRTDPALLRQILPEGFSLRDDAVVILEFSYLTEIDWLAGRGYNMLTLRIPVRYQQGDTDIDGFFQPVVWENLTEPILSGREELGWSKIYADLPELEHKDGKLICRAEWMGFKFLELTLMNVTESQAPIIMSSPVLHRKYIPATQRWGEADVDYVTMTPAGASQATLLGTFSADPELSIFSPRWEDMPTQHACVAYLAQLPRLEYLQAGIYSSVGGKDLSDQIRLD